jgi:hypothetical protein
MKKKNQSKTNNPDNKGRQGCGASGNPCIGGGNGKLYS